MKAAVCAVVLAGAFVVTRAQQPARPFDLLITHARIIDGTGGPSVTGAVGVRDGQIAATSRVSGSASRTIDARGQVLAPGFIDAHSHSDFSLLTDGNAESKIRQGVTTGVIGESGSVAPRVRLAPGGEAADTRGTGAHAQRVEDDDGLVADAMKQGAYGVATGLIYSPNAYAKLDELIALSKPAAAAGGIYASHLRDD